VHIGQAAALDLSRGVEDGAKGLDGVVDVVNEVPRDDGLVSGERTDDCHAGESDIVQ
jgi:hypothetical protein